VNESSGDEVFDKSALRAVFQADPFPAVPTEVMGKIRKAGGLALRFTPKGMQ
jgi:TonB family protein